MLKRIGALLLSFGLMSVAMADARVSPAEALMRKSGLWEQLGTAAPQIQAGMDQAMAAAATKPSKAEAERVAKAAASAFSAPKLRAYAAKELSSGLLAEHIESLQAWYGSPTGQKLTRLEEQASANQTDLEAVLREGEAVLEQSTPERRALLEALLQETRAVDSLVDITLNIALAAQRGAASASHAAPSASESELRAMMEEQRPQLVPVYTGLALASFAVTYKSVSDADLESYLAFLKSPAGRHFYGLSVRALDTALSKASEDFGRRLSRTADGARS